ncbi:MAG: prepilin-type N-terminal cleavage/methylation domain-containing protein [Candidatus Theseobacter exili]|nr:prepilin-type N-terminal cleavage/methylation domain-containing protein [Candidatus Theseobacter exili]
MKSRNGYSAFELLVVVAVIAILAAIIFPTYQLVREGAKRSVCINNLRQLGEAVKMYVLDSHMERLPEYGASAADVRELPGLLYYYLGERNQEAREAGELDVFDCPTNRSTEDSGVRQGALPQMVDYKFNPNLYGMPVPQVVGNPMWVTVLYDWEPEDGVHSGRTNIVFYDGHVETLTSSEMSATHDGKVGYENWGTK